MSRYVEPKRPQPWGPIYTPDSPDPEPPPMTDAEKQEMIARAAYVAPYDIVEGARQQFRDYVEPRDRVTTTDGQIVLSDGAERYFGQYYYSTMASQQVDMGVPGSYERWGGYSVTALNAAKGAYDREQRPQ